MGLCFDGNVRTVRRFSLARTQNGFIFSGRFGGGDVKGNGFAFYETIFNF